MSKKYKHNSIHFSLISLVIFGLGLIVTPGSAMAEPYYSYAGNAPVQNIIPNNPVPYITSITPNSVTKNTTATITVYGYNFVRGSVIRMNGLDLNTQMFNASTLSADFGYSNSRNAGSYSITVLNPAPGGGSSNQVTLTVKENTPVVTGNTYSNTYSNTYKNTSSGSNKTYSSGTTSNNNNSNTNSGYPYQSGNNTSQTKQLAANAIFGTNAFMPSSLLQWIFFFILILLGVILWRKLYVTEEEKNVPLKHA